MKIIIIDWKWRKCKITLTNKFSILNIEQILCKKHSNKIEKDKKKKKELTIDEE